MKQIEIDGVLYDIDIAKCLKDGYLHDATPIPFEVGNIYKDPTGSSNEFVLVQAIYMDYGQRDTGKIYCLLALSGGFAPNSNPFFKKLSSKEEILAYLKEKRMVCSRRAKSVF